uniref:DNA helicase INO80-like n=1 Tax=Rhizophora mucronata TaxID=61149 RepID=A0A2P2MVM4_RHIMU
MPTTAIKQFSQRDLVFNRLIESLLPRAQLAVYCNLCFPSELRNHILFNSSKHERLQNCMQSVKLVLIQCTSMFCMVLNSFRKPLVELFMAVK